MHRNQKDTLIENVVQSKLLRIKFGIFGKKGILLFVGILMQLKITIPAGVEHEVCRGIDRGRPVRYQIGCQIGKCELVNGSNGMMCPGISRQIIGVIPGGILVRVIASGNNADGNIIVPHLIRIKDGFIKFKNTGNGIIILIPLDHTE